MRRLILAAVVCALAGGLCAANRIIATVGNRVILESDIVQRMRTGKTHGEALEELVIEKLMLVRAERDGITASREEIAAEAERFKANFPGILDFSRWIESENISREAFSGMLADNIKMRKLVRRHVAGGINIPVSDIMEEMEKLKQGAVYAYNFRLKWFNDRNSAERFMEGFSDGQEAEMGSAGWLGREELLPQVLEALDTRQPGDLAGPVNIGARYMVLLLKEVQRRQPENIVALYKSARSALYNREFAARMDAFVQELQQGIPVVYHDK